MTNMCGLCNLTRRNHGKTMQVERQDGKRLEYTAPILVKELLQKFPGAVGVALSHNHHHYHQLPLTYKLRLGTTYYLLPKSTATPQVESKDEASASASTSALGGTKRIKVLITKQQLQQLVSNQISVQDVLMVQKHTPLNPGWMPDLHSIAEGDE